MFSVFLTTLQLSHRDKVNIHTVLILHNYLVMDFEIDGVLYYDSLFSIRVVQSKYERFERHPLEWIER